MAGKQITELTATDKFEIDDLMLIRKAGEAEDKKITGANVIKSIGNTAVDGFIATSTVANQINLASVNGSKLDKYYDNMRVSFISPIDSNDAVTVQINTLGFRDFKIINTNNNVTLKANTFVNAIYKAGVFYQTNVSQNVFTNDYYVSGFAKAENNSFTNISLTTAYGVQKKEYYEGMNVVFRCPDYTVGIVRIKIDNIAGGFRDVFQNVMGEGNLTNTANLYKGQIVRLYFDGVDFVLDQFDNTDPKMLINPIIGIDEATQTPIIAEENKFNFLISQDVIDSQTPYLTSYINQSKLKKFIVTLESYLNFSNQNWFLQTLCNQAEYVEIKAINNITTITSNHHIYIGFRGAKSFSNNELILQNITITSPETIEFFGSMNLIKNVTFNLFGGKRLGFEFLNNQITFDNFIINHNMNNIDNDFYIDLLSHIRQHTSQRFALKFINSTFNFTNVASNRTAYYQIANYAFYAPNGVSFYFENCTFTSNRYPSDKAPFYIYLSSAKTNITVHLKNCIGFGANVSPNTSNSYYKYIVE